MKFKYVDPLSNFAVTFNLRRYIVSDDSSATVSSDTSTDVSQDTDVSEDGGRSQRSDDSGELSERDEEGMGEASVGRCRLKPADARVESALISLMGEAPYGPLFTHFDKWGRPPMHHLALESKLS